MKRRKKRAFTVVEMVMVMIILAIIAGMGVFALVRFYELWLFSNYKMEVLWSSRNLMRELTMNTRMARDKTSVYIATSTRFSFYNLCATKVAGVCTGGNTDYQYLGAPTNALYKNGAQFMREVSSFSFTYYLCDKTGVCNLVGAPAVSPATTNINTIKIDSTLTNPQQSISSESAINLRNLN